MINYVCGLVFTENRRFIRVIEKTKPSWMLGKLNGIGGKIEPGETHIQAMCREYEEEAGVQTTEEMWSDTAILRGTDFSVYFYHMFNDQVYQNSKTMEEEIVYGKDICEEFYRKAMPNLRVIIPIALDTSGIVRPVLLIDGSI